jgi:hypothetical protein
MSNYPKRIILLSAAALAGGVPLATAQASDDALRTRSAIHVAQASFQTEGECLFQNLLFYIATYEQRQGNTTTALDESTSIELYEENWCLGTGRFVTAFLSGTQGAQLAPRSASFATVRNVELQECLSTEEGFVCQTRSVPLTASIVWASTGDFLESNFVRKGNLTGQLVKSSQRLQNITCSVTGQVTLDGEPLIFATVQGSLTSQLDRESVSP